MLSHCSGVALARDLHRDLEVDASHVARGDTKVHVDPVCAGDEASVEGRDPDFVVREADRHQNLSGVEALALIFGAGLRYLAGQ